MEDDEELRNETEIQFLTFLNTRCLILVGK